MHQSEVKKPEENTRNISLLLLGLSNASRKKKKKIIPLYTLHPSSNPCEKKNCAKVNSNLYQGKLKRPSFIDQHH
jgi:hypothetical protein